MIVYKQVNSYSRKTGEKKGSHQVYDHTICDFTGERIDKHDNPNSYSINFNYNDPCFGDGDGEEWLYKNEEYRDYYQELFSSGNYMFKCVEGGVEVFQQLMEKALKELGQIYSLDHLLRWSRGKMLEKILDEGTYKLGDFVNIKDENNE